MADLLQMQKKIALLHRYPKDRIKETNAAFPYLQAKGIDVLTFKTFNRLSKHKKFWKGIAWILYAPILVFCKGYDVIYCDDSFPFYPALVKLVSPKSKVIIRLGDLHLMYYYSGVVYKFLHFFEKLTWRMVDGIIPISTAMAEEISKEGLKLYNIQVVLDPVDPKDFPAKLAPKRYDVMFHGVLTKNKNIDVLIEAAWRMPQTDFLVVGDGPELKRLMSKAPMNIFFTGWVPFDEVKNYIAESLVGVALRGNNEGNQYVVTSPFIQCGIMGKPCLVTRRKVFGDYEWQFSGVHEMVSQLQMLLRFPVTEGNKLEKYIIENHDANKIGEEIWQILTRP